MEADLVLIEPAHRQPSVCARAETPPIMRLPIAASQRARLAAPGLARRLAPNQMGLARAASSNSIGDGLAPDNGTANRIRAPTGRGRRPYPVRPMLAADKRVQCEFVIVNEMAVGVWRARTDYLD